jgi:thiamine-phosphate pyrophosphorylase
VLDFDLYPVTCEKLSRGRANLEVLDALVAGGARVVQLREKDLGDRDFLELARAFRGRTRAAGMTFIVNDRVDVALACGADGVHLGQDDLPVRAAREILGPDRIIGASTHNVEEALRAEEQGADYVNVGPIYETATKTHAAGPVGIALFTAVRARVRVPITVMGGIKLANVEPLVRAGARRIAVVTAVVGADDIAEAVRGFRRIIAG